MKILKKSLLHTIFLFITIFVISAAFIMYFSRGEAGSASELIYSSFLVAIPFLILALFPIYIILDSKENNKKFWKRFLLAYMLPLGVVSFIATVFLSGGHGGGGLYIIVYCLVIFLLVIFYKFLFKYSEKITIYLLILLLIISIFAIIVSVFMHGGCLSGDTNCFSKKAIEENDISICNNSYPGTICEINFYQAQENEAVCSSLVDEKARGIFLRSGCYSYFANKKNDPSLCKFDDVSKKGCCSSIFNVDLYGEGLSEEQKSVCGIMGQF